MPLSSPRKGMVICFGSAVVILSVACESAFVFAPLRSSDQTTWGGSEPLQQASENGEEHARRIEAALAKLATGEASKPLSLRARVRRSSTNETTPTDVESSRENLVRAQMIFDQASSHGDTATERAIKNELNQAVASSGAAHLGKPWRPMPTTDLGCLQDFSSCPVGWASRGVLCLAGEEYEGPCGRELELSDRTIEQIMALGQACHIEWPCQGTCALNFEEPCPAMWKEVREGVCEAPAAYGGTCSRVLDTGGMSDKDKASFGEVCGAAWPCQSLAKHNYNDVCPVGWTLEGGEDCKAPEDYEGPCNSMAHMKGLTVADKKRHEASCGTKWPEKPRECARDYSAPCPFGWFRREAAEEVACIAPMIYVKCNRVQRLHGMRLDEKREWAAGCMAQFPCRGNARSLCEKDYTYPCPADWFVLNGGQSCHAPGDYGGPCPNVLHGLVDFSDEQKDGVQHTCDVSWPCVGESALSSALVQPVSSSVAHRSVGPATYTKENGPVHAATGAIVGPRM